MNHYDTYADFLKKFLRPSRPIRIVVDGSNGTAGLIASRVFESTPIQIIPLNFDPHPDFPAHGPNPLEKGASDSASKTIKEEHVDFGALFDADGDRIFFLDEQGNLLPSYVSALLLFSETEPPYVTDELIYNSLSYLDTVNAQELFPSKVGTLHIKEEMTRRNAGAGAEFSGHMFFKDFFSTDSGMFALMTMINAVSKLSTPLSSFYTSISPLHEIAHNLAVKTTWQTIEEKLLSRFGTTTPVRRLDGLTFNFEHGWINVRPSNTEPLVRIIGGSREKSHGLELLNEIQKIVNSSGYENMAEKITLETAKT